MIRRLINWLKSDDATDAVRPTEERRRVSAHHALHARTVPPLPVVDTPDIPRPGTAFEGRIQNIGPGKNVLVRDGEDIDDTATRETLKLFGAAPIDPAEPTGIDPYNSGQFDRSRHWDTRFRN